MASGYETISSWWSVRLMLFGMARLEVFLTIVAWSADNEDILASVWRMDFPYWLLIVSVQAECMSKIYGAYRLARQKGPLAPSTGLETTPLSP